MGNENQYKADFIREFGNLFLKYGDGHGETLGIHHTELTPDGEYVRVYWWQSDTPEHWDKCAYTTVCVACDSLGAMVYDIMKKIL